MNEILTITYCMILLGCACACWRLYKGPDTLNRILAFDYLSACIISLIALHSIQIQTDRYLEMILIFSLLGFATVISFMEAFFGRLRRKG